VKLQIGGVHAVFNNEIVAVALAYNPFHTHVCGDAQDHSPRENYRRDLAGSRHRIRLGLQCARMKHLLGLELARREALSMAVVEQLIYFGPSFPKTPEVDVGTRSGLFFLP
jgi:hypothetical protein